MEDMLDLYAEPYDPRRPVVCFDDTSTQLLADTREPLPGFRLLLQDVSRPTRHTQRKSVNASCNSERNRGYC